MQRRTLIQSTLLSGFGMMSVGASAWASIGDPTNQAPKRLVVVFLRGAVDGLNIVVPYADPGYYRARSSIAIARPGSEGSALDLDGQFGLHPALSPLMPFWLSGKLAFVHASGSNDATRSHFDAQDFMESGTPGRKSTPDGWLNRLLGNLPSKSGEAAPPTRAVSVGAVFPRIYAGTNPVANIANGTNATKPTMPDRPGISNAFDKLYSNDDKLSRAYQASRQAHAEVMESLDGPSMDGAMQAEMQAANNGAPLPNGFPDDAARLGTLMRNDSRVQLAFMALGGWDTHTNQGAAKGQLANRLNPLGQGLTAIATRLGPAMSDTVIVVMSEFGRTVNENGNGGTDHGHGNVMWLLGGPVAGGKVHGRWPGLSSAALYEGRDLAVTTDFRQVLSEVVLDHLALPEAKVRDIFPQFTGASQHRLGVIRT
ncbi:MAG: DUF1501 domain-containing protein [Verrucomicrobiota bacterium]